jgi:hypothetical protein
VISERLKSGQILDFLLVGIDAQYGRLSHFLFSIDVSLDPSRRFFINFFLSCLDISVGT